MTIVRLIRIGKFVSRYIWYRLFFGFYHLGWPIEFGRLLTFTNPQLISIGKQVNINEFAALKCITDKNVPNTSPKIIIGNGVGVGMGTQIVAAELVKIEDDVIFAPYCFIGDFNHQYLDTTIPITHQELTTIAPIHIKKGSWIGTKTTICAGVKIGKNTVIGANSVVTKDIPDYAVAVGNPAKVIKKYDPKTKEWRKFKNA